MFCFPLFISRQVQRPSNAGYDDPLPSSRTNRTHLNVEKSLIIDLFILFRIMFQCSLQDKTFFKSKVIISGHNVHFPQFSILKELK